MAIATLTIDINAKLANLERDLGKVANLAEQSAKRVDSAWKIAGKAFIGAFSVAAVGGFATTLQGVIQQAVDAADQLNDLSKQTGIAVDTLGGLGFAASLAGGDLESIVSASDKLNKSIAEAARGNKEYAGAFDALGLNVKTASGELKTADVVLAELADKFESYADGPNKVAIAQKLMGEAGAKQIGLLNDGGKALQENIEYYKRFAGVTQETATKADQFNDTMAKLQLITGSFGRTVAGELVGPLTVLSERLLSLKENSTAFQATAERVASALVTIGKAAVIAGFGVLDMIDKVGAGQDKLVAFAKFDFAGAKKIQEELGKTLKLSKEAKTAILDALDFKPTGNAGRGGDPRLFDPRFKKPDGKPQAPGMPGGGGGAGSVDDASKNALDNALKDLERRIGQESELLASRNRFLDLYNGDNLLSIKDYYAARNAAQQEQVANTVALYDKEIAALEAYKAKAKKATEQEATQEKINDIIEKKAKLQREASESAIVDTVKQGQAYVGLKREIDEVNASLLELQGQSGKAVKIRIENQFADVRKRFEANNDKAGLQQLDALIKAQGAQADYNQLAQQSGIIQDQLRLSEERASVSRYSGAITELDYLKQISGARLASVRDLEGIVAGMETVAAASQNPALLIQAESARVALEKLRAESDLLSQKFNTIFTDSASSAFADFISGTKSAKDAFKSFANSVNQEINKIVSQELASKLFGKGGAAGGLGGFFGNLFGGSAQTAKASGQLSPTNGMGIMGDVPSLADSTKTAGGSVTDFFGKLFGGGQSGGVAGAAGAAAADASLVALSTAATTSSAALTTMAAGTTALDALTATLSAGFAALSAAASSASAALASVAGSSGADGISKLVGSAGSSGIDFGGFFANGGDPPLGKVSVVGEQGPELFIPKTMGTIIPNKALRGGGSSQTIVNNNFTINGPTNRSTEAQLASAAYSGVTRASRRNG